MPLKCTVFHNFTCIWVVQFMNIDSQCWCSESWSGMRWALKAFPSQTSLWFCVFKISVTNGTLLFLSFRNYFSLLRKTSGGSYACLCLKFSFSCSITCLQDSVQVFVATPNLLFWFLAQGWSNTTKLWIPIPSHIKPLRKKPSTCRSCSARFHSTKP